MCIESLFVFFKITKFTFNFNQICFLIQVFFDISVKRVFVPMSDCRLHFQSVKFSTAIKGLVDFGKKITQLTIN